MKRYISRILLIVLLLQFSCGPLFAQSYNRGFDSYMGDEASGMSFRKKEIKDLEFTDDKGARESVTKGRMMTDSSISGLIYQVHILGEVKNPGTYRITASDRLSEVVLMAGGFQEQGSQRNVEVRRSGGGNKIFDLLSFQLYGNLSNNPYLLDNDVIYVPIRKKVIQIVGAVMRPSEYELKNEKTLDQIVELSGGFSVGAAKSSSLKVIRFIGEKKNVLKVFWKDSKEFEIKNGDVIFVPHVITERNKFDYDIPKLPGDNIFYPSYEDRVFILGGVTIPGAYRFNPYYSLSQYLSLAGGTTKLATDKIVLLSSDGKRSKVKKTMRDSLIINPGDTIVVREHRIPPEGWINLVLGIAGFGLSASATILALTR